MYFKLDHWSCNLITFDREINVLLFKMTLPEKRQWSFMSLRNRSPNVFDKKQVSQSEGLMLRSRGKWGSEKLETFSLRLTVQSSP